MAEWSEAQVSEWISLIDLPGGCAEAVQEVFADMDGQDLLNFIARTLQKMLCKAGAEDPAAAAKAVLRQRNIADGGKSAVRPSEAPECPLCMEPYADDELHVPRILQCGHTGCHDCYAQMLRPIVADDNAKKLACPTCRVVTKVRRGRADNLPQVFGMLR